MKKLTLRAVEEVRAACQFDWGPYAFNGPESYDIRFLSQEVAAEYRCQYAAEQVENMVRQCVMYLHSLTGIMPEKQAIRDLFEERFKEDNHER